MRCGIFEEHLDVFEGALVLLGACVHHRLPEGREYLRGMVVKKVRI